MLPAKKTKINSEINFDDLLDDEGQDKRIAVVMPGSAGDVLGLILY